MKALIFDASSIISLAMNNLLWILEPLKKQFKGKFYIPLSVKKEIIDKPLKSKRFKLEAFQVLSEVNKGVITIFDDSKLKEIRDEIEFQANHMLIARGRPVHLVHSGEIAALALAKHLNADALVIDERTMRTIIENPKELSKLMRRKLHTTVNVKKKHFESFKKLIGDIKVVRSVELGVIAYEKGLFKKYKLENMKQYSKKELLDGIIWGLKLRGCSMATSEIDKILQIEGFSKLK